MLLGKFSIVPQPSERVPKPWSRLVPMKWPPQESVNNLVFYRFAQINAGSPLTSDVDAPKEKKNEWKLDTKRQWNKLLLLFFFSLQFDPFGFCRVVVRKWNVTKCDLCMAFCHFWHTFYTKWKYSQKSWFFFLFQFKLNCWEMTENVVRATFTIHTSAPLHHVHTA